MAVPRLGARALACGTVAATLLGAAFAGSASASTDVVRHGMVTRNAHAAGKTRPGSNNLYYHGGSVSVNPKIYIVYWGSQWGSGTSPTNDPSGEVGLQLSFFQHMYGAGDNWSTSTTQYCQGVASGTTQCGTAGTHVGHPAANPVAGTWLDNTTAAINGATSTQIATEAKAAAAHFNDYTPGVQYIVDFPRGVEPSGFAATSGGNYCAWHDSTVAAGGTIAFTNMPYMTDAGSSCGSGFVPTGTSGVNATSEGVTIVGGHEYAETLTDQWPSSTGAWQDSRGSENGDKCAWISSGQGASSIVSLNGANFAVQSLWSNNYGSGAGGCAIFYNSATSQG